MPRVSVIVPVYNVENYIGRCIESVLNQTLIDWELILVDDCSSDNSYDIICGYSNNDKRIVTKKLDKNHGPMVARRVGDEMATGEYITYCDSDDWLESNALEIMYKKAIDNKVDVVIGQFQRTYEDGRTEPFTLHNTLNYGCDKEAFLKSILRREIHQGVAGKMFSRNVVQQSGFTIFEHCTMSEDAAVLFQFADKAKSVACVEEITYNYFVRSDSSTQTTLSMQQIEGISKTSLLRLEIVSKYPYLIKEVNRYLIQNIIGLLLYKDNGDVMGLFRKYKLDKIISTKNIFRSFSFMESVEMLIRRDVIPNVSYLRNHCLK